MNEFLHLFQAGGFMMYPLLAASIIAVAITVERARMYRKSKTDMTLLASHLSKPLHEGKLFEAEKIAANAGELERGAGLYLVSRKKGGAAEVPAEPASHPAKADTPSPISQASRITAAQTASGAFSS